MFFLKGMNPEDRLTEYTVRRGQFQIRLSADERKEPDDTKAFGRSACRSPEQGKK